MKRKYFKIPKNSFIILSIILLIIIIVLCCARLLPSIISIVEFSITIVSFTVSLISVFIIYSEFLDGSYCTIHELKKGVKDIAAKINRLAPTKIIILTGNTKNLFYNYIKKMITIDTQIIELECFSKEDFSKPNCTTEEKILSTYKFWIKIKPNEFHNTDKILIFDDVAITSNTLLELYKYFTKDLQLEATTTLTFAADYTSQRSQGQPIDTHLLAKIDNDYYFPWR